MSSGGSQKQRPSAQEIALARVAADKDARYQQAFVPLEQAAIDELKTASQAKREALLGGRSNADIEQQAGRITFDGASGNITRGIERGFAIAGAKNRSRADAGTTAQASIDQDRLNVIKTGQNMSRSAGSALANSARMQNSRALSKLNADRQVGFATGSALGQLVTAGAAGHMVAKDNALRLGANPPGGGPPQGFAVPYEDLSFYSKTIRNRTYPQ